MNFYQYLIDETYNIDGYIESDDEIIVFISERNEKQKQIPSIINGKKVVI